MDRQTDRQTQSHSIDPLRGLKAMYVGQILVREEIDITDCYDLGIVSICLKIVLKM